ncbi:MAG: CHRD domain-containing protein [Gemmatimonadaceae bacterium]
MKYPLALLVAALSIGGCGSDFTPGAPADHLIESITLSVPSTEDLTSAGDTRTIIATAQDAGGETISSPHLVWSSVESNVATITASGSSATVTAVNDGTATISASSGTARATITVRVKRKLVSIEFERGDSVMPVGSNLGLRVIARDARQHVMPDPTEVKYTSDNPGSIIVSPTGDVSSLFTAVGNHSALVSATLVRDGVMYRCERRFSTLSTTPPILHYFSYMIPLSVLPEPVEELGEAIVYFRREDGGLKYKIYWSYLTGAPTSAHLHVSPDADPTAEILVDIPLPNNSGKHGVLDGTITAASIRARPGQSPISMDSLTFLMGVFGAYFDIHTARHLTGELGNLVYPSPWPPIDAVARRRIFPASQKIRIQY